MGNINWNNYLFPADEGFYLFLKIFCILFNLSVIAFILYVWIGWPYLRKMFVWDLQEFFMYHVSSIRRINKDWNKIIRRVKTNLGAEYKLAVIEADLLLNEVLMRLGYDGKTLLERVEKVPRTLLPDPESVRYADGVYQNIVKDPKIKLDYQETKKVIMIFHKTLSDLDAF